MRRWRTLSRNSSQRFFRMVPKERKDPSQTVSCTEIFQATIQRISRQCGREPRGQEVETSMPSRPSPTSRNEQARIGKLRPTEKTRSNERPNSSASSPKSSNQTRAIGAGKRKLTSPRFHKPRRSSNRWPSNALVDWGRKFLVAANEFRARLWQHKHSAIVFAR